MPDDIELIDDEETGPEERLKKLREKLLASEKERKEYLEGWQRAKADLVNSKREEVTRFQEGIRRAQNYTIYSMLPVLDSFDRALGELHKKHLSEEAERGFSLIRSQFTEILKQMNITEIESIGKPFDPARHEAVAEVESEREGGTVIEELEKGYEREGRVIRPARVTIAKYR